MRITGWTVPELRAAPARVVRAHFVRIFAGLVWSPELAEVARTPTQGRAAFGGDTAAWARAAGAKARAAEALKAVEQVLWPEDEPDAGT